MAGHRGASELTAPKQAREVPPRHGPSTCITILAGAVAAIVGQACGPSTPRQTAPPVSAGSKAPRATDEAPSLAASAAPHDHAKNPHGYHLDFSDSERLARHFDGAERDSWQKPEHVTALLELKPGQHVVDLGAGTGYFLGHLSKGVGASGRVTALDIEENMVAHLQERAQHEGWNNVTARVVPEDNPQLEKDSVDRVLIVNTWHHIADRDRYAAKLATALRPGGSIYVVDFTEESDIGPPARYRLSADQVESELRAGGLKAEILAEQLPKQYVVRGARTRS